MPKLKTESEEQFLTRIKKEFRDANIDLILIESGGFFIGSWEQLDDCFALYPNEVEDWCTESGYELQIIKGRN